MFLLHLEVWVICAEFWDMSPWLGGLSKCSLRLSWIWMIVLICLRSCIWDVDLIFVFAMSRFRKTTISMEMCLFREFTQWNLCNLLKNRRLTLVEAAIATHMCHWVVFDCQRRCERCVFGCDVFSLFFNFVFGFLAFNTCSFKSFV